MIPARRPFQSFDDHQAEVAAWMGCDVNTMNRDHDPLHHALCDWLGVESEAMKDAAGEPHDAELAGIEEEAVLMAQRLMVRGGGRMPE